MIPGLWWWYALEIGSCRLFMYSNYPILLQILTPKRSSMKSSMNQKFLEHQRTIRTAPKRLFQVLLQKHGLLLPMIWHTISSFLGITQKYTFSGSFTKQRTQLPRISLTSAFRDSKMFILVWWTAASFLLIYLLFVKPFAHWKFTASKSTPISMSSLQRRAKVFILEKLFNASLNQDIYFINWNMKSVYFVKIIIDM